jgi:hypothetical protein
MRFYAIQEVSTGNYLPLTTRKATRIEPAPIAEAPPRLFLTQNGANRALGWFLRGVTTREGDIYTSESPRDPENYVVVEVALIGH